MVLMQFNFILWSIKCSVMTSINNRGSCTTSKYKEDFEKYIKGRLKQYTVDQNTDEEALLSKNQCNDTVCKPSFILVPPHSLMLQWHHAELFSTRSPFPPGSAGSTLQPERYTTRQKHFYPNKCQHWLHPIQHSGSGMGISAIWNLNVMHMKQYRLQLFKHLITCHIITLI